MSKKVLLTLIPMIWTALLIYSVLVLTDVQFIIGVLMLGILGILYMIYLLLALSMNNE